MSDVKYIGPDFHGRLTKSKLSAGDVVTVRTGKPGTTAVVPRTWETANCADLVITRAGPNLSPHWLSYYLNSAAAGYISASLVGAVQQHFNVRAAQSLRFALPPMRDQLAITEVLGALDDKIAANVKQVAVADKVRRSCFEAMLTHSESQPLSGTAHFINGRAFTKDASGSGRVVIRIAELNSGIGTSTVYSDLEVPEQHLARPGDLLFAWSGSLTLHRWYRPEAIINQHIFKVIPKDNYPIWLVDGLLQRRLQDFKEIAADKATTMGHIQRRHLDEPVGLPDQAAMDVHGARMAALWNTALAAEQESLALAAMRDALLPHLMSGRLRVRDAEKIVSDRV